MKPSAQKKLKIITNLDTATPEKKKQVCEMLGTQLWLINRRVPNQNESFINKLLFEVGGKK